MATIASASPTSVCSVSFSIRAIPALWTTAFSVGKSATTFAANALTPAASSMSRGRDFIPGLAAVTSSSTPCRRPEMMTLLPSLWNASASPRPMPDPPPVIRIVLPFVSIAKPS